MRGLIAVLCFVTLVLTSSMALAGGYVYGTVKYPDGSKCSGCKVSAATPSGVTSPVYTNSSGKYKLPVSSGSVVKIYISGSTKWSGSKSVSGGVRIDITM